MHRENAGTLITLQHLLLRQKFSIRNISRTVSHIILKITLFFKSYKSNRKDFKYKKIEVIAFLSKLTGLWPQYVLRHMTEKIQVESRIKQFRI